MPGEFQKGIKFDDIRKGDLIVVELFGEDGSFLGDRRGYAVSQKEHGVWTFSGMSSLYREALGYRLFRVEPKSAAEVELERLAAFEEKARDMLARRRQQKPEVEKELQLARDADRRMGEAHLAEYLQRLDVEILVLENLCGKEG